MIICLENNKIERIDASMWTRSALVTVGAEVGIDDVAAERPKRVQRSYTVVRITRTSYGIGRCWRRNRDRSSAKKSSSVHTQDRFGCANRTGVVW
jgi:hypothetical protein